MKKTLLFAAVAALVLAGVATGADSSFKVKPWTFVGAAGDCGTGYPAGSNIVTSAWVTQAGLPDAGKSDHALFLQKNGPTADCSSAGASIDGVNGIKLSELGYDVKNGSHCSGGAPRFNVVASDGFHFVGACTNGTFEGTLTDSRGATWSRYRFSDAQAFPPISPTATVSSIDIVFDEGTDQGTGQAYLDNIDVNGTLIGKPGNS